MAYIIFKDINSNDIGIKNILSMPLRSRAEQKTETISIPGRAEPLRVLKDNFNTISLTVEMELKSDANVRAIMEWISGSGQLIFSDETDKYYMAVSSSPVGTSRINSSYYSISVKFDCQPFAYAVLNDPVEVEISGFNAATIEVDGNYYCQPIYKIYGSGDITFTVNGTSNPLILYDVDEYVVVDTSVLMCHKEGTHVTSKGKLPFLSPGINMLSWSSNVTAVELTKNERWL